MYPSEEELQKIIDWDYNDPFGLIDYILSIYTYAHQAIVIKPGKDDFSKKDVFVLELHTLGISGNESIINILQDTKFWTANWKMSVRGGHYTFEIIPERYGYLIMREFCKQRHLSRQGVSKNDVKYAKINLTVNKTFVRLRKDE